MRYLKFLSLFFVLMTSISVLAQRERNYIYLLDCTKSMIGFGGSPVIWQPTKDYLRKDLDSHTAGTTLHIVPFQDKVLPAFNFKVEEFSKKKWNEIESNLNKLVENVTNTNICDAWDAIDEYIDLHKDNYIVLLTDGHDNVKGMGALVEKLKLWCGKYPNTYAFYVLLTEAAIDAKVVEAIDLCDNEYIVNATDGIPVFGGFDKNLIIYANTLNLKKVHKISFSSVGEYKIKVVCRDPYFDVKIVNGTIVNGIMPVQIVAKKSIEDINASIPQTYDFTFDVKAKDIDILNPTIHVQMTNKPERTLETISEETDMGDASWYDRFLFWGARESDTLDVDLKSVFNEEAMKDGAKVELVVTDPDGGEDFHLFYNHQPVGNGRIIISSSDDAQSILSIVFNPDAKEGNRYLTIKAKSKKELDKINNLPIEQYELSLRSHYEVTWNPLKTIIMWVCIIVVIALLLWFLLIKHLLFPTIGVKTIQINDPYFSKVNVKGMRRVVFTNKTMKQGLLNRVFTGEILYKQHDIWTSQLAFEAGSKRKTLRVMRTSDYMFDPLTSTLKAPNDYVAENINDRTKIKITIN